LLTGLLSLTLASSAFATGNPEVNPPTSTAYGGGQSCYKFHETTNTLENEGSSEACQNDAIAHLNEQREKIGQGKYTLPKDFDSLSSEKQIFILANSDRVSYGETPYAGLVPLLNEAAKGGVLVDADPVFELPKESEWSGGGSIWAGSFANAELAYYAWMYDDGPGGSNLATT
jgi:hypothetical protein